MAIRHFTRPLAVILFALLSLAPLLSIVTSAIWPPLPDGMPRGAPVQFPHRFDLTVLDDVGKWFADRIDRSLPWRSINAAYQVGLLRRSTEARVAIGPDGWLFWTDEGDLKPATMANFRGRLRLTEEEVQKVEQQVTAMHATLSSCEIVSLVVIVPNKQSIYGEHLLRSEPAQKTMLDDFLPRLDPQERSVLLDLRQPLWAAKGQAPGMPLYFKTDSHWNALGAFHAYVAIISALAKDMPIVNLPLATLSQYTIGIEPNSAGDLARNLLSAPSWFTDTKVELHRRFGPAVPGAGRLLILGDSFSAALMAYFGQHFSRVDFKHFATPLTVESNKPSVVLLEIVERYLPVLAQLKFDWTKLCAR